MLRQVINLKCPVVWIEYVRRANFVVDPVNWSIFAALFSFHPCESTVRGETQESTGRDDGSSVLFRASCRAEFNYIRKKRCVRASMCAWPRADRVPELTLFFARPLSTLTLGAAGARCHVTARRCTSHRRMHRAHTSLSTMPGRKVGRRAEKSRTCVKNVRHGLSTATLASLEAYAVKYTWQLAFFLLVPFESLTVDSARFCHSITLLWSFFHSIER